MNGYKGRFGWVLVLALVLLGAAGASVAYNIGLSHGIAQSVAAQGTPVPVYPYAYRPWGFGFGFPLLFFAFLWFAVLRGLWWGGPWGRHRYYMHAPPSQGYGATGPHARCYGATGPEHTKEGPSADDPGRRG